MTPRGWLMLYGVRTTASKSIYRVGLALFDRDEPERCLLRGDDWIFAPEEPYERERWTTLSFLRLHHQARR